VSHVELGKRLIVPCFARVGFDTLKSNMQRKTGYQGKGSKLSQPGSSAFYDRAKSQTNLQEKVMLLIPGFHGYKEKEIRRESDKLLRNQIYQKLSSAESQAKDTYRSLVNQGINDTWDDTDHLMARLDRVVERINHSEYGYAGFFDVTKVKEPDLDRMMDYDYQLLQMTDTVTIAIQGLKDSVDNGHVQDAKGKISDAMKAVDALETAYNGRKDVILGVQQ
jgi:hypothetical protein